LILFYKSSYSNDLLFQNIQKPDFLTYVKKSIIHKIAQLETIKLKRSSSYVKNYAYFYPHPSQSF